MRGDELKNWLAVLGIGGGLALGGPELATGEAAARPLGEAAAEPPRAERGREPVYVVINHEEQYSIWPAAEKLPRGWRVVHQAIELAGAVKRFPKIADQRFQVVINHEEQYSIWPRDRKPPRGFSVPEALRHREPCRIDECGRLLEELAEAGGS